MTTWLLLQNWDFFGFGFLLRTSSSSCCCCCYWWISYCYYYYYCYCYCCCCCWWHYVSEGIMDDFRSSRAMPRTPPPKGSFFKFGLPFLSAVVLGSFVLQYFTRTRYEQQETRNVRVMTLPGFQFISRDLCLITPVVHPPSSGCAAGAGEGVTVEEENSEHPGGVLCEDLCSSLSFRWRRLSEVLFYYWPLP